MPDEVGEARFYAPTDRGFEAELSARLARLRELRGPPGTGATGEG